MRRIARAAIDIIRVTFARERLGGAVAPTPPPRTPRRYLRMLVSVEPLPVDPPSTDAPRRSALGALGALLAIEPLPRDPEEARPLRPPRSLLRSLFGGEPLPLDPVVPASRRSHRLAALFAPESLDDL